MILQSLFVARLVHILENLNHDARVALCVQIDFLVIGDLAYLAAWRLVRCGARDVEGGFAVLRGVGKAGGEMHIDCAAVEGSLCESHDWSGVELERGDGESGY